MLAGVLTLVLVPTSLLSGTETSNPYPCGAVISNSSRSGPALR
jgi:hypothetical protein